MIVSLCDIVFMHDHRYIVMLNPLRTIVPHHVETSQLVCIANQLTGFYMMRNVGN